jgi:hypothetical protein
VAASSLWGALGRLENGWGCGYGWTGDGQGMGRGYARRGVRGARARGGGGTPQTGGAGRGAETLQNYEASVGGGGMARAHHTFGLDFRGSPYITPLPHLTLSVTRLRVARPPRNMAP